MKICAYCERRVDDVALECPHCMAYEFKYKCEKCGAEYSGGECPQCVLAAQKAQQDAQIALTKRENIEKAQRGLVWKTVLTFFLPFIGAYFLITPYTKKGFKIFAIAWSALCAFACLFVDEVLGTRIAACMLCLIPIVVGVCREKKIKKQM